MAKEVQAQVVPGIALPRCLHFAAARYIMLVQDREVNYACQVRYFNGEKTKQKHEQPKAFSSIVMQKRFEAHQND